MGFEFRDAKPENLPLLVVISGGTSSGKTESAMRLATGLAGGEPFAVIDTEIAYNREGELTGRSLHKAGDYKFKWTGLEPPYSPERYIEAIEAAEAIHPPVIVIDSGSHEYEGVGGVLDIQAEEFKRLGEREGARMTSWIVPKMRHRKFVQRMLRTRAHVILCLRAEDKIEVVKVDGKTVVRPKASLTGAEGWIPICEKRLPFEATMSFLLTADAPGVPKPIKLEARHKPLIPLGRQLDESVGVALAKLAAGSASERDTSEGTAEEAPDTAPRSLAEFDAWMLENEIPGTLVGAKATDLYGSLPDNSWTPDQFARLAAKLVEREKEAVA